MAVTIQWHPMHALRSHTKISQNGHQTTFFNWMFAISIQISSSQIQNERGSNPPMILYTCYIVLSLIKLINTGIWKTPGQLNVPASIHPYSQVWSRETVDSNCWSAMSSTNGKTGNRIKNYMKGSHGQKKDIGDESKASAKNRFLSISNIFQPMANVLIWHFSSSLIAVG